MSRYHLLILSGLVLAIGPAAESVAQDATDIFDVSSTSLDKGAAQRFAADLVEYAQGRCKAAPDFHVIGDYRKLIRVAYQLAPEAPAVVSAHARIKQGFAPEPPKKEVASAALMTQLLALAKQAKQGASRDSAQAAKYLYAIGQMIEPGNSTCLVESEMLQKRGGPVAWEKVLAVYCRDVPDGHTSSINGLVVMTAGGTTQVGQVSRILLTYRSAARAGLEVKFLREGGGMMVVSMEEAVRYWDRLRKSVPLPTGTIEISFEDKFSKKDGPSAGAAYTVLMRSFSDPFKIDPAFAMTGDVSVEGRILQVGGVFAKSRGAALGKCTRVGIPASNEVELTGAIVLHGPATLAEIEVYGLETIEDAVALARTDKAERVEQVTALFAGLPPLLEKKLKSGDKAKSAEIQQITAKILECAPRHLSAKLIDAYNNGTLPQAMTLSSSLDEAGNVFYKYLVTISPKGVPNLGDIAAETKTTMISAALKSLRDLKPKLHKDAQKSTAKLEEACATVHRYISAAADIEEKRKRMESYKKKIEDLKLKIDRAKAERQPAETINRLVKQHNEAVEEHKKATDRYDKAVSDRKDTFVKAVELYNEYTALIRELSQDPQLLEKLIHGK